MFNKLDEYVELVGGIKTNLFSLELYIRKILCDRSGKMPEKSLDEMEIGEMVQVNEMTNYDTLGELIEKYNNYVRSFSEDLLIDRTLVTLRDAFAHGRVFSRVETGPYFLLKFDKPEDEQVKVTFKAIMDNKWLKKQIGRVRKAVLIVDNADKQMNK